MAKKYIIWGSSGHAKVLASAIKLQGDDVVALFDNNANAAAAIEGVPLCFGREGFAQWATKHTPSDYYGLVAIGGPHGAARLEIHDLFAQYGVHNAPLIHPQSSVCASAKIGEGTQVLAHALVAAEAVIGKQCILNHRASVDHECVLGNGVHLAPSATLCGLVELGNNVMIATGATVLPRVKIGANTIIGAGSVVVRDVPANVVAYGSPARIIRNI